MADYYPLIARAIAGLDASAGLEQRHALYVRAREALLAQLRGVQPALSESEITRERLALEDAIRKVELEAARRSRAARPDPRTGARPGDSLRGASARSANGTSSSSLRDRSARSDRTRSDERDSAAQPSSDIRSEPRRSSLRSESRAEARSYPPTDMQEPPAQERPGLARRRTVERDHRADDRSGERIAERGSDASLQGFRDVIADADELGSAAAEANRAARRTYANVPSPSPEFDRTEPGMEDRASLTSLEQPDVYEEASPETERARPSSRTQRTDAPLPAKGKAKKKRAPKDDTLPELRRGFPVKRAFAFGILLIVIGAVISNWSAIRGLYQDWTRPAPVVQSAKDQGSPATRPKINDRVGQNPSTNVAPVAQRVVLYDEDPAEPQGKQYVGTVVWRTEAVPGAAGQAPDVAIRADIDIPDRKMRMTLSLRRNSDSSLPASHTLELTFNLPPDFAGGNISNVPGVLMKSNEQARGTPLSGLAVKVTDGFFLVGLSNVETDRQRNLQLLKERSWFDIPLVYGNQRRAIIAIEKGEPGERAFNEAFAGWGQ